MEPTATCHDAIGHDESSVRHRRVSQLGRPGVSGPLAEIYADRVNGADGLACVGRPSLPKSTPLGAGMPKGFGRSEEDDMHPMFVKLFLEADADDPLAEEEDKRHRANRARRTRSRMVIKVAACDRERGGQPS